MYGINLTKNDTIFLKGIALLLLLLHHLFCNNNGLFNDYYGIMEGIASFSKVCVAIFVFLSGYGLMKSNNKKMHIRNFYKKRFIKLYMNYWLIWLLFVPIGIYFFGRTFDEAYQGCMPWYLILDFFGLLNCLNEPSYNVTWWFYSCIILLYIFFPWLRKLRIYNKKYFYIILYLSIFLNISYFNLSILAPIKVYLFPFLVGMECAIIDRNRLKCNSRYLFVILILLIILRFLFSRLGGAIDVFITFYIISSYKVVSTKISKSLKGVVECIGKHSFNVFLFHTFIFYYYFKSFIYSFYNPVIIFIVLLTICLALSVFMEKLKHLFRFYELQNYIIDKL